MTASSTAPNHEPDLHRTAPAREFRHDHDHDDDAPAGPVGRAAHGRPGRGRRPHPAAVDGVGQPGDRPRRVDPRPCRPRPDAARRPVVGRRPRSRAHPRPAHHPRPRGDGLDRAGRHHVRGGARGRPRPRGHPLPRPHRPPGRLPAPRDRRGDPAPAAVHPHAHRPGADRPQPARQARLVRLRRPRSAPRSSSNAGRCCSRSSSAARRSPTCSRSWPPSIPTPTRSSSR